MTTRVRRLEQEIDRLREDLLSLAPADCEALLHSYVSCETRQETCGWENMVAERIAAQAKPLPSELDPAVWGHRANCPLCRRGADNYYGECGFKLPEGLRRHLIGFGRTHQCVVMRAAKNLARDYWHSKFHLQEQQEERDKQQLEKQRLATETIYVLAPNAAPVLLDSGAGSWRPARSSGEGDGGLQWAEKRLAQLGFDVTSNGSARAYTRSFQQSERELVVYADPRHSGAISFRVFDLNARGTKRGKVLASFDIPDRWKNKLEEKVVLGIAAAQAALRR